MNWSYLYANEIWWIIFFSVEIEILRNEYGDNFSVNIIRTQFGTNFTKSQ